MSNEPKLLTEAEWREYYAHLGLLPHHVDMIIEGHRECGLIAPEPDKLRDAVVTANRAAMHELHFTDTDAEPAWLAAFVKHLRALDALIEAAEKLLPKNINLATPMLQDSDTLPLDVRMGDLRALSTALANFRGSAQ